MKVFLYYFFNSLIEIRGLELFLSFLVDCVLKYSGIEWRRVATMYRDVLNNHNLSFYLFLLFILKQRLVMIQGLVL